MVAAVGVLNSQAKVMTAIDGASPSLKVNKSSVLAAAAYPADAVRTSQARINYIVDNPLSVRTSQARIYAAGVGRVFDPKVRVFTFTLDGHDYLAIRLGPQETLIYDTHSDQFYVWGSGNGRLWKAYDGVNWPGGGSPSYIYGSNIVVGDDANGSLYFLDPNADQDDDSIQGSLLKRNFTREVSGQVALKGYAAARCYGVELLGSIGQHSPSSADPSVTLSYSDDRGVTYVDANPVTIDYGDYSGRVFWRSLGSIRAPGRIFNIRDYGALKRIDSLTMIGEQEGKA